MIVAITGASSGIGAATARRFAEAGHELILLARRKDKLEALARELKDVPCSIFVLDVTSRARVEKVFKEIGKIDVLVNNAGGAFGVERAQEAKLDDWDKCIDANVKGLMYCVHAVLPNMVKQKSGHIINIRSIAGTYPYPSGNAYCGAKAFAHQFSLSLRADLVGTKVRVSCIEPGLTGGTEFSKVRYRGDEGRAQSLYENTEPLQPEDIAETIYFCATLPAHVNINTIEMMPVSQAFSPLTVHKGK